MTQVKSQSMKSNIVDLLKIKSQLLKIRAKQQEEKRKRASEEKKIQEEIATGNKQTHDEVAAEAEIQASLEVDDIKLSEQELAQIESDLLGISEQKKTEPSDVK